MDTKEITKISSMNAGSASWFLCSTPSRNFEELHEKVMTYEELQCCCCKELEVSVHALTDYIPKEGQKKQNVQDKGTSENNNRRQWRNLEDYNFDLNNMKRWFKLLVREGKMTPRDPPETLKPGDEKKDKFCCYHQRVNHATRQCREIMDTI